ncbi:hypothetical protein DAEQUDRAFT_728166 [Daedalea quercina L-15889]|uniref:Uncharacterized protein n=1 Tax=Daedalea quercina L-15889 TaxID=1314783 RepID=A0A165PF23_9APHY|nr:hypothetical protein DAEQUDRAFT_728166 [Daedalea quercina L-15889]
MYEGLIHRRTDHYRVLALSGSVSEPLQLLNMLFNVRRLTSAWTPRPVTIRILLRPDAGSV